MAKTISVNTPANQQRSPAVDGTQNTFRASRFTIRFKLTAIIVTLITVSLGSMIYLASKFFSDESVIRIQESNLNLTRIVGNRVEAELENIREKALLMAFALRGAQTLYANSIFESDPEFVFFGIANSRIKNLRFIHNFHNEEYMKANELNRAKLKIVHAKNQAYFEKAKQDKFAVYNTSLDKLPLLGISCRVSATEIAVLYLHPESFFKVFQGEGAVIMYMVDELGNVVAHQDSEHYLSYLNLSEVPIVKAMLQSPVNTGQLTYVDTDGKSYIGSFHQVTLGNIGIIAQVDEDMVFAPVRKLQERNILILLIVLLLALLFVYFFAKTLSAPLTNLMRAVKKIDTGQYDIDIEPAFRDEIGSLTHSFRSMAVGLGEREKIKDAFGRFVNKEVAEQILHNEIKLSGEKKYAAVFFSDMRGFTAMVDKMPPEDVVAFLNEYFTEMVRCIDETHGIVDKYIGDAIMAHWGALSTKGNETENAINAALMMRTALLEFNRIHAGKYPTLRVGCGINSGEVVSGQVGSQNRLDYTVIGDPVNTAARLEALNKPMGTDILISGESYERARGMFNAVTMPALRLKGKLNLQEIYAVLGRKDDPECPRNLDDIRSLLGIPFDQNIFKLLLRRAVKTKSG